ncbi:MAG TPA: NAD-dependent epimerase/dehydratase family protein [Bdellovibrionota bacterium]|nr:NAD-dependent epimerase/dehydratase family protein [Bdellovibrionota bacterium]
MKALVTGASGFIGSALIEELSTLGFEVHALMRKTSSPANLEGLKFNRVEGDICNPESLKPAVKGMNYVFHLAGLTAAPNRAAYLRANAEPLGSLAAAVAEAGGGLSRFVHVSSLAAGGPVTSLDPRTEEQPDQPVSAYGESKLEGERLLLKYKDQFPISIVRPPMVYGPRDKGVFVMIQTVARNLMPVLQGSTEGGHKYYSAIHVKDLCRGIVQAAVVPPSKVRTGEKFYLAGEGIFTYVDLMSTIAERLDADPLRIRVPKFAIHGAAAALSAVGALTRRTFPLNLDKVKEILPDYWICSNQKAKNLLGFAPEFDLSSGMAHAIEWYKRQRWI